MIASPPPSLADDEATDDDRDSDAALGDLLRQIACAPPVGAPGERRVLAGRYVLAERLGGGGMGAVYRARDITLDRDVAVKVLAPEHASRPELRARALHEARAASRIASAFVARTFDVGEEGTDVFLVMELVRGATLRAVLDREHVDPARARRLVRDLAAGLAAAHEAGIAHRDLKPENVVLDAADRPKILDFGIARLLAVGPVSQALGPTLEGTVVGTAGYLSPEQARGEPADARSDVFAFGLVAFEILVGRRVFPFRSADALIHAVRAFDPSDERAALRGIPDGGIIRRCLDPDPSRRYQDGKALHAALSTSRPLRANARVAWIAAALLGLALSIGSALRGKGGGQVSSAFGPPVAIRQGAALDRTTVADRAASAGWVLASADEAPLVSTHVRTRRYSFRRDEQTLWLELTTFADGASGAAEVPTLFAVHHVDALDGATFLDALVPR